MGRKPRILLGVTADLSLTLMRGVPQHLVQQGWDVHVVTSPGRRLQALSEIPGVNVHPIEMKRDPSPVHDLISLGKWLVLLARVRPDVVSVGTPKASLLGIVAAWITRRPKRVYHLRGLRLETASGFQLSVLRLLEKLTSRLATHVLSVSNSLRDRVVQLGLVDARKVTVLGSGSSNGVQLDDFDPARADSQEIAQLRSSLGLVPGVPVVGFVGRLTADKGLHVLAEARRHLEDAGVDYQLLVIGDVDDREGDRNLAALNAHGRDVTATGYVDRTAPYYQLMDLFCLPTYREGFPNVVLEASASGLATVTTDATGAIDSVVDGVTGIITTTGDARSLADGLKTLITSPDLRQEFGARALERVRAEFSRQHMWELVESYYRSDTGF